MKMNRSVSLLLIAMAAAVAAPAYSAPSISAVSGSATAGTDVTISGTGFGTKASATKLWDAVDNQPSYMSLAGSSVSNLLGRSVPVGSSYVFNINSYSYPGAAVFSSADLRHPVQKMHYRTSSGHGYLQYPNALGGQAAPSSQTELYVSFWIRPDASVSDSNHSSKFMRVWDDPSGTGTRISWTQMHLTAVDSAGYSAISWADWGGTAGRWNRMELFVSAPKKLIRAWINGRQIHNIADFRKDAAFAGRGLNLARVGWDPGGVSPPTVNMSFGEVYVDSTQARVELCSQPTWAQCQTREVQPATSWADNKIVFKMYPGMLTGGALYAYVIDASGAVNTNGVALVAGKTPSAPTSLSAN